MLTFIVRQLRQKKIPANTELRWKSKFALEFTFSYVEHAKIFYTVKEN